MAELLNGAGGGGVAILFVILAFALMYALDFFRGPGTHQEPTPIRDEEALRREEIRNNVDSWGK